MKWLPKTILHQAVVILLSFAIIGPVAIPFLPLIARAESEFDAEQEAELDPSLVEEPEEEGDITKKPNPIGCLSNLAAAAATAGGWFTGGLAVLDLTNLASTIYGCVQTALGAVSGTVTSGGVGYLVSKSKADAIATTLLKTTINVVRDMIIRWILTGRFEGPVFSASFAIDVRRAAENASRAILQEVTSLPICAGLPSPPPQAFFNVRLRDLSCSFNDLERFRKGEIFDYDLLALSEAEENDYWNRTMFILDQKLIAEAAARESFTEDYRAGRGFLCIRDEKGRCTTPGSAVGELVMDQVIRGPREEGTVAQTTQQAIGAIIDTAIRVVIEKGLGGVFGPSR
mgnify:CR=1 FL=1